MNIEEADRYKMHEEDLVDLSEDTPKWSVGAKESAAAFAAAVSTRRVAVDRSRTARMRAVGRNRLVTENGSIRGCAGICDWFGRQARPQL